MRATLTPFAMLFLLFADPLHVRNAIHDQRYDEAVKVLQESVPEP